MLVRKRKSNSVAKERLKLVLIHDRYGNTPDSNMMKMIKRDIMRVISNYVEIDESNFDLEITRTSSQTKAGTKLVANIPIVRVKNMGRNW